MNLPPFHSSQRLAEAWGDQVGREETEVRSVRPTQPTDRRDGQFLPFFGNEYDLQAIWGLARRLAIGDEIGAGLLDRLTDFTIGTGFTYRAEPKQPAAGDSAQELAAAAQEVIDEFLSESAWEGDLERELFAASRRDGEFFLRLQSLPGRGIRALTIEPECVTEPADPRVVEDHYGLPPQSWSFGVATDPSDTSQVNGYFVQRYGDSRDWEFVPASEMIHCRINVERRVKRGLSDFYAAAAKLEKAGRLLGNTLEGSTIQAAIAFIREHAPSATRSQIESFQLAKADTIAFEPRAAAPRARRHFYPGTVLDVGPGMKYHAAPLGQTSGPIFLAVVQAALRAVGARWGMPEYMISGDASNANYSSTLVAGSPFVRATEARQSVYRRYFGEVMRRVVDLAVEQGRFLRWGIAQRRELARQIEIVVTPPQVAIATDAEAQERVREIRHRAGVLSKRTWAAQVDLDFDQENRNQDAPTQ